MPAIATRCSHACKRVASKVKVGSTSKPPAVGTDVVPLTCRTQIVIALGLAVALGLATPALAASPTFLPGSRVGLVPPEGMVPSRSFQGYEDAAQGVILFVTEF